MRTEQPIARGARRGIAVLLCAGAAVLVLRGPALVAQDPPPEKSDASALAKRVDELEKSLAATNGLVRALSKELTETAVLVDQTVRYLKLQADSAQAMTETLAQSEELGFTYGINPKSRETLLAGWRERLQAVRTALPGAAPEAPAEGQDGGESGQR